MKKLLALLLLSSASSFAQAPKVTQLLSKDIPEAPGREVSMITVEMAPGAPDGPIHRHNAQTFVYVLEGTIVMRVRGGKQETLGPGQAFYESPTDTHIVGHNASKTQPAKFLVFFVKKKGAPNTIPAE